MKCYYFDTSALVKNYFEEKGAKKVKTILEERARFVTSCVTFPEMFSVFYRLHRDAHITSDELSDLVKRWKTDWPSLAVIEFSGEVRDYTSDVFAKVAVRGADSVHLASCLFLRSTGIDFEFVSCDRQMNVGAKEFGLKVVNPLLFS